ncbi:MAG: class I SAM-dependent methyltransferase [Treponema sp.]|nr:class I SAM-dependent methyltransferase [Treponema sp.]
MVEKQESITAKLCSFARAFHSNFGEKKIFDDYLAFDLMGKNQYEEMGQLIENGFDGSKYSQKKWFCHENIMDALYNYILPIPLSRISFAEKELADFASKYSGSGKKIQYVICGAGMDSFAFRNTNENIHVFEIDHPDTQKYKKERINELEWMLPKNLTFVPVDFTKDSLREKLLENGFNPGLPTFTAILGVSYYLELPVFEETLKIISDLTSDESRIIFDFPDKTTKAVSAAPRVRDLAAITEKLGEPMVKGFSIWQIRRALGTHSLRIERHEGPKEIQKKYFLGRSDNLSAFENVHFVTATKRQNIFRKIGHIGSVAGGRR